MTWTSSRPFSLAGSRTSRYAEDAASTCRKVEASFNGGAYGGDQLLARVRLQDVPPYAQVKGLPNDRAAVLDGDEHDSGLRLSRENRRGGGQPVDAWHRDIADDRV